jgi:hypothetical protein
LERLSLAFERKALIPAQNRSAAAGPGPASLVLVGLAGVVAAMIGRRRA